MVYDIVVIGAGPAGLAAALYGSRANKSVFVLEKEVIGGQMMSTATIENVPGSVEDEPFAITTRMRQQAQAAGAKFKVSEVLSLKLDTQPKQVEIKDEIIEGKTVIIATGATHRQLGLENETEYSGKGLTYCATCDGPLYTDLPVYVVGGGDAAFDEGIYLASLAKHVTILYRGDTPRATKVLQDRVAKMENMDVVLNTEVESISGDPLLDTMVIWNNKTGEKKTITGDFGLFIYVGMNPNTELVKDQIALTPQGYVDAGEDTETNVPGVYAAGDVRVKEVRQIVTALSDGAVAALRASKYVDALEV